MTATHQSPSSISLPPHLNDECHWRASLAGGGRRGHWSCREKGGEREFKGGDVGREAGDKDHTPWKGIRFLALDRPEKLAPGGYLKGESP